MVSNTMRKNIVSATQVFQKMRASAAGLVDRISSLGHEDFLSAVQKYRNHLNIFHALNYNLIKYSYFTSFLFSILSSYPTIYKAVFFIISLISVMVIGTALASDVPIEEMKDNTVRVLCKSTSASRISSGSGVIVGSGNLVLTNHHVIECNNTGGEIIIIQNIEKRNYATVVWKSEKKDLAILHVPGIVSRKLPVFATSDLIGDAQTVYAMGFPSVADLSRESLFQVKITKGIISNRTTVNNFKLYQIDAALNPGNSGGPLFDESGQVIGINIGKVWGLGVEGIGYAIQIDEILAELDRLGIYYHKAITRTIQNPFITMQPSTSVVPRYQSAIKTGQKSQPLDRSISPIIYIILGIIMALSLILIFLMMTKRRKVIANEIYTFNRDPKAQETTNSRISMEEVITACKQPLIVGISGIYAGTEVIMGIDSIAIGRDPNKCQLVIPDQDDYVGRLHCVVRFDPNYNTFFIEDRNSINGTYLDGSVRLTPGKTYELASGGRFSLANSGNTFEVRLS